MHECENILDQGRDPLSKKLARFLRKQWASAHHMHKLTTHVAMWNSGVLGFASNFFPHLDEVLQLTDELYTLYPKHVMEQLALSFYLQEYTQVHDAREYILHYWHEKDAYNAWIAQFLAKNPSATVAHEKFDLPQLLSAQLTAAQTNKCGWFRMWRSPRA